MEELRAPRRRIFGRKRASPLRRRALIMLVAAALVICAAIALETPVRSASACVIKGDVSQNTGERIYHLPGQQYYDATRIDRFRGERWFCSEAEAAAAGWRRAKA
jgi:hypothetical protein